VKWLSCLPGVNPSAKGDSAIYDAALRGRKDVVAFLLSFDSVNPSSALVAACTEGHEDIVELLLANAKVDPTIADNKALSRACRQGYLNIAQRLLRISSIAISSLTKAFTKACSAGSIELVRLFIEQYRVNPSKDRNRAILNACASGNIELVEYLLQDYRVNPSDSQNLAIQKASQLGHHELVRLLMKDTRVSPIANNNATLRLAVENGRTKVVEVLLEDPRIDPAFESNAILFIAMKAGHSNLLRQLLLDPRLDPMAGDGRLLYLATKRNDVTLLSELLRHPRIQLPQSTLKKCFLNAASMGYVEILKVFCNHSLPSEDLATSALLIASKQQGRGIVALLLSIDVHLDVLRENQSVFKYACWWGWLDIVQKLLADERISPGASDNEPFVLACKGGHLDVIKTLMQDHRVNPAVHDQVALRVSIPFPEILGFLLSNECFRPVKNLNYLLEKSIREKKLESMRILVATGEAISLTAEMVAAATQLHDRYLFLFLLIFLNFYLEIRFFRLANKKGNY
jgi:ankyrin repeat protein